MRVKANLSLSKYSKSVSHSLEIFKDPISIFQSQFVTLLHFV